MKVMGWLKEITLAFKEATGLVVGSREKKEVVRELSDVVKTLSGFLDNSRLAFGMLTCRNFLFTNAISIPYRKQLMQAF